jgi:hypothetical protein
MLFLFGQPFYLMQSFNDTSYLFYKKRFKFFLYMDPLCSFAYIHTYKLRMTRSSSVAWCRAGMNELSHAGPYK